MFNIYWFSDLPFDRHDLEVFTKGYCIQYNIPWDYAYYTWLQGEMYKRDTSLQEVEIRIGWKWKAYQRASKLREMAQEYFVQDKAPMKIVEEEKQQVSA